jgi:cytochrome c oxidase accessory protein FixG
MTTPHFLPEPTERVLSTLNQDGTRRWLKPRLSHGRFLRARRIVAYFLIAIFTVIPHIRMGGKPLVLLDVVHREFTFFGQTFLPTDTVLLALILIGTIVTIFLVTALFGRAWCGYACPQTVYMEFVYRPLERLLDGTAGKGGTAGRKATALRTVARYGVYLLVSMFLAHTFLAYFVGVDALRRWIFQSPFEHPTSFLVMAVTTALMMFDFCYFREQTCIVACPYGRLQSVLLDRDSLIVSYDPRRGEPRGKGSPAGGDGSTATVDPAAEAPEKSTGRGDCIDCGLCVTTCPTGIDIRDGLKMECIGCAQCIDACDAVMDRLRRPRGLVRYSSQARIAGLPGRLARARVFVYPVVLVAVFSLFVVVLLGKQDADVTLLRGFGVPFVLLENGVVSNQARLKITNRGSDPSSYRVEAVDDLPLELKLDEDPISVDPGESVTRGLRIEAPVSILENGRRDVRLRITDGANFTEDVTYRLLGPADSSRASGKEAARGEA